MDNVNFERDPKSLFEKIERRTNHIAQIMKFVKKLGSFGETYGKKIIEHLKCHGWVEKVSGHLRKHH